MKKKQSKPLSSSHSPECRVQEFDIGSKNMSLAVANIHGRYPEKGSACNTACEQIYHVVSGSATLHLEKGDFEIKKGDTHFFNKKEAYWLEAKDLEVVITNTPAWIREQYKIL
jgi:mannose-6-phosphate isomerase-like protein (cupin superfamily)